MTYDFCSMMEVAEVNINPKFLVTLEKLKLDSNKLTLNIPRNFCSLAMLTHLNS